MCLIYFNLKLFSLGMYIGTLKKKRNVCKRKGFRLALNSND